MLKQYFEQALGGNIPGVSHDSVKGMRPPGLPPNVRFSVSDIFQYFDISVGAVGEKEFDDGSSGATFP
jgi:hypothetical protein